MQNNLVPRNVKRTEGSTISVLHGGGWIVEDALLLSWLGGSVGKGKCRTAQRVEIREVIYGIGPGLD